MIRPVELRRVIRAAGLVLCVTLLAYAWVASRADEAERRDRDLCECARTAFDSHFDFSRTSAPESCSLPFPTLELRSGARSTPPPTADRSGFSHHDQFPLMGSATAAWVTAPDDVWVVDTHGTVLNWDGQVWSPVRSGDPSVSGFRAIWASGRADVWVVASKQGAPDRVERDDAMHPFRAAAPPANQVLHWDGREWIDVPLPGLGRAVLGELHGSSPRDLWVTTWLPRSEVRYRFEPREPAVALALHWNGRDFEKHEFPAQATSSPWVVGPTDAWLLTKGDEPGLWHWDGRAWTRALSVDAAGLWSSEGSLWLATRREVRRLEPSGEWSVSFPAPTEPVCDVVRTPNAWARSRTGLYRFGDAHWQLTPTLPGLELSLAAGGQDTWLFGAMEDGGAAALQGTTASLLTNPTQGFVSALSLATPASGWAIARGEASRSNQTLLRWNGSAWSRFESVLAPQVLWAEAEGGVWIGGRDGIAHFDGARWGPLRRPGFEVRALWSSGPADVWAAGYPGGLAHWDGASWRSHTLDGVGPFFASGALGGTGRDDVWVAGKSADTTRFFHWDGHRWASTPPPVKRAGETETVSSIWGAANDDTWAVGELRTPSGYGSGHTSSPLILHWNGRTWSRLPFIPVETQRERRMAEQVGREHMLMSEDQRLSSVWGRAADDVWAVGSRLVLHFDGRRWSRVDTGAHDDRRWGAVAGTRSGPLWLGGERGLLASLAPHAPVLTVEASPPSSCARLQAVPRGWWRREQPCAQGTILESVSSRGSRIGSTEKRVWCRTPLGLRQGPHTLERGTDGTERTSEQSTWFEDDAESGLRILWEDDGTRRVQAGVCRGRILEVAPQSD